MEHRHLSHQKLTLAAIDDIICRGKREDWLRLRNGVRQNPALLPKLLRICLIHANDPFAQRYHLWLHYAQRQLA